MDYEKTVGYDYDLEAYKRFLDLLDAPQKDLKNVILIGGTKGKGSTAAIVNACLLSGGYKVGLYSSPHLSKVNERIKINNRHIADTDLENLITRVKPHIIAKGGARSFFEALTTIAFIYFLEKQTDFAILEVGLGGRLDATNATDPLISVITRVGYDHTNLLGTTLSQITNEKAGIIRNNGKLITIHQRFDAERTVKPIAKDRGSSIIFADDQHKIEINDMSLRGSHVDISGRIGEMKTLLPLTGAHQTENLSLALAVLFELKAMGFYLGLDTITSGIANTQLHGRFEVVSEKPLIIFDCAHNEDSFRAMENTMRDLNIDNFHLIFGTNKDKDITYCLRNIFPKAQRVLLVKSANPRAVEPEDLLAVAKKHQPNVSICNSVADAIHAASINTNNKPIIIAGSFYLWQKEWKV